MKLAYSSFIFLLILSSCKPHTYDWKPLDFGAFKIKVPTGWNEIKEQGIDSYVGGITNKKDTLWFEYGRYSVGLGAGYFASRMAIDTINGMIGEISIPNDSSRGYLSLRINHVNENIKFIMYGKRINVDTGLKIFKSIVFKESDSSNNSILTINKFTNALSLSGENLFKSNCAPCHKVFFDFTGPSLFDLFNTRSREWLYQFLTNRKLFKSDSVDIKFIKHFGFKCLEFPALSKDEVYAIYNYCN